MDTFNGKDWLKTQEDFAGRKEVKEEEVGRRKWKLKHRLPNLYTAWMGPLVRVTYSGLTQSVFRLDRVKSSSCDCPTKIPVDMYSNARCFTCFSSGSSSPEVAEFCPTLCLVYFIAWA
jgi:hypothetical protein